MRAGPFAGRPFWSRGRACTFLALRFADSFEQCAIGEGRAQGLGSGEIRDTTQLRFGRGCNRSGSAIPSTVPREEVGTDEKTAVYEVTGERIHVGESVRYSPLRLLVRPGEKDLQSDIFWYATELGPQRYVELAKEALSDARSQIRDTFGSSARLMDADITTMLISFEQAAMAAIRHLDSAANMRNEKLEDASYRDGEASTTQRTREADKELAFVSSIIVESVVDSAMKPKAWLEEQRHTREGPSLPFRRLQASSRAAMGQKKRT